MSDQKIFGRPAGKVYDQVFNAKLWCEANPGKKLAIISTRGRLEMIFTETESIRPQPKEEYAKGIPQGHEACENDGIF